MAKGRSAQGSPSGSRSVTTRSKATPKPNARSPKSVSKNVDAAPTPGLQKKVTPRSTKRRKASGSAEFVSEEANEEELCKEVGRVLAAAQQFQDAEEEEILSQSYFGAKQKGSARKSSKKISDIHLVEEKELKEALKNLVPKHEVEQAALLNTYKDFYQKWLFQLKCDFGLLMYGFGSKRQLLEDFASTTLIDAAAVVVNGYLPTINLKEVMRILKDTLYQRSGSLSTSLSLEDLVAAVTDYQGDSIVYVIIHSIDGPALRDNATQQLLARLAACPHFFIVASMDNINGPLLWDKKMANTQFKWLWHHTPTYLAYTAEAAYVPLVLSSSGVRKNVRNATLVLQSLTPNAQSVFKLLAEYQLANVEDEGLTQHQLYTKCRERFLVSSELTLRAHLTEFKDHQLVRLRKGSDGQDCLYIALPTEALTKLLDDLKQ